MFGFLKPKIIVTRQNDQQCMVDIRRASKQQVVEMTYAFVSRAAKFVGWERREMMNKLIELDKTVVKQLKKDVEK